MGKYMRNSKSNNVIDGVRTRAKILALQTQVPITTTTPPSAAVSASSFGYLQLRNRRLLRLKPPVYKGARKVSDCETPNLIGNPNLCNSDNSSRVRVRVGDKLGDSDARLDDEVNCDDDGDFLGENVVESDLRESLRSTRESTPSNLIRDSDSIHTPASSTRPTSSAEVTRRLRSSTQRNIPTSHEMEEFFADAEEQQQREFIQKYNFDPANDKPLPGRYEWKKLKP